MAKVTQASQMTGDMQKSVQSDLNPTMVGWERKEANRHKPVTTGDTVSIACKLPNGLQLYLTTPMVKKVPTGRGDDLVNETIRVRDPGSPLYVLNGNRVPFGTEPSYPVYNGYAITRGIPKDFFEAWMKENHSLPCVQNGLLYVIKDLNGSDKTLDDAKKEAKNRRDIVSGLEPLNVTAKGAKADPRIADIRKHIKTDKEVSAEETNF